MGSCRRSRQRGAPVTLEVAPASGGSAWLRRLYGAALALAAPLYWLRLWWRGRREPLYRHAIGERFGRYGRPAQAGALWLHAVSLGETRAAAALIAALRHARPGLRLLLTHGTATGREAGRELLRPGDAQVWLPYDTPGATARFFAWFRPVAGVLMETEIWPNLLQAAAAAEVPMVLASARLSQRSRERGDSVARLLRPAFDSLSLVLAQTDADAERLRGAGARRVLVCGNLKFDVTPGADLLARGRVWRAAVGRPVLLAAVTRDGEEAALLAAWQRHTGRSSTLPPAAGQVMAATGSASAGSGAATGISPGVGSAPPPSAGLGRGASPGGASGGVPPAMPPPPRAARWPLLVIVPRHPQRFEAVAALVSAAGLRLARRSAWAAGGLPPPSAIAADVWVGDSLGEMPVYYALAQVALLGGSFEPLGGHNLIEAAACGCPLLMGPHTFNFAEAARLSLLAGAALRVDDIDAAVREALVLLGDEKQYLMAARAMGFAAQHRGAARRMATQIVRLLAAAGLA